MKTLSVKGVLAPIFIALAMAAGVLELRFDSRYLTWLGLGFLALGLAFARDTRRLLTTAFAVED